jgi:hypothetical protein
MNKQKEQSESLGKMKRRLTEMLTVIFIPQPSVKEYAIVFFLAK